MRLTRNTTEDGKCKYAIVRLDKLREMFSGDWSSTACGEALETLKSAGVLEYGESGSAEECFVIKLKDRFAAPALRAYATAAGSDPEYRLDVLALAERAASRTDKKRPD